MNIASTKLNTGSFTTEKSAIFDIIGNPGLLCLIGSRMFLNLKEAGNLEVNEGTDAPCDVVTARSVSDLHFAAPASSFPNSETETGPQVLHSTTEDRVEDAS